MAAAGVAARMVRALELRRAIGPQFGWIGLPSAFGVRGDSAAADDSERRRRRLWRRAGCACVSMPAVVTLRFAADCRWLGRRGRVVPAICVKCFAARMRLQCKDLPQV
jgi:hypothetical protein